MPDIWDFLGGIFNGGRGRGTTANPAPVYTGRGDIPTAVPSTPGQAGIEQDIESTRPVTLRGPFGGDVIQPPVKDLLNTAVPMGGWQLDLGPIGGVPATPPTDDRLPFTDELERMMATLEGLIKEVKGGRVPQHALSTARDTGRQAAIARNIEGPLAASIETSAQTPVINAFEDKRMQTLSTLLGLQGQTINWSQMGETQRRVIMAQLKQAEEAARQGDQDAFFNIMAQVAQIAIPLLVTL